MKTLITFAKALWGVIKRICGRKPVLVPNYLAADRRWKCEECQHYDSGRCKLCNCVIAAKVYLASEQCPDDPPRWKRF